MHTWTIHKTRRCSIPFTHHPHTAVDSERWRRCISPRLKPSLRLKMAYARSTIAFVCQFCLLALTQTIHQSLSCLLHALRAEPSMKKLLAIATTAFFPLPSACTDSKYSWDDEHYARPSVSQLILKYCQYSRHFLDVFAHLTNLLRNHKSVEHSAFNP